jgi:hypothetical protein
MDVSYSLGTKRKDNFDAAKSRGASDEQALAYANEMDEIKMPKGMMTTAGYIRAVYGTIAREKEATKKLDDAILASVQRGVNEQKSQTASQGSTAPHAGATYVSNITLPGGKTAQVRFADSASQSAAEQLLRELAQAKGVAS